MIKKNIHKLIALGLSMSMIMGLTACGGSSGDSAQTQTPAANTNNEAQTPAADSGDDKAQGHQRRIPQHHLHKDIGFSRLAAGIRTIMTVRIQVLMTIHP